MAAKTLRRYVSVSDESESESELEAVKVTRKYTSHVYKKLQQFSDFETANKTVRKNRTGDTTIQTTQMKDAKFITTAKLREPAP
jgi:hypothetical protein